ncbi:snare-like protein [Metschnikowia bicuspidata var. bicuspidata NRRL YB-4993]|uniref:Snare-like protein n=1 Tax=Metschnikowia bicuspidata var. bicuspidata NRRL YB-4993 TaxID=869754 RepID=A0A1A0HE22_9ASCO|nr:snare-like protein [Metschnikowia bicuspidata var. bicuspidata NRRL YB-4993]OBA22349.1 snare-like protein [Metschnikowia bicuspidata var. bicuspidata NRRL YB-4993]
MSTAPKTPTAAKTTAAKSASVLFVSLVSRDDKPLYIQSFEGAENAHALPQHAGQFLKYNFLSHMALDVFASPMSLHLREQQEDHDGVLLLFIQDDVYVYGMETNNGLKVVVGASNEIGARPALRLLFLRIHRAYLKTVCNPFTDVSSAGDCEQMLHTPAFERRMHALVGDWEK